MRAGVLRPGYGLSLVGALVVAAAGFVDMVWHTVLGVEADLDALLSPPHLLLITAGTLVFAGPLRAALKAPAGTGGGLPTALSAALVVTGLGFFTQYANPFTHLYPVAGYSRPTPLSAIASPSPPPPNHNPSCDCPAARHPGRAAIPRARIRALA